MERIIGFCFHFAKKNKLWVWLFPRKSTTGFSSTESSFWVIFCCELIVSASFDFVLPTLYISQFMTKEPKVLHWLFVFFFSWSTALAVLIDTLCLQDWALELVPKSTAFVMSSLKTNLTFIPRQIQLSQGIIGGSLVWHCQDTKTWPGNEWEHRLRISKGGRYINL